MRRSFCDRCNAEIPDGTMYFIRTKEFYRWRFWFSRNQKERLNEVEHELCAKCMESLWHWWCKGSEEVIWRKYDKDLIEYTSAVGREDPETGKEMGDPENGAEKA